jgi:hypothetical protein
VSRASGDKSSAAAVLSAIVHNIKALGLPTYTCGTTYSLALRKIVTTDHLFLSSQAARVKCSTRNRPEQAAGIVQNEPPEPKTPLVVLLSQQAGIARIP